jgi:hypothetical protein
MTPLSFSLSVLCLLCFLSSLPVESTPTTTLPMPTAVDSTTNSAYDPVVSKHILNLAGATYCSVESISSWDCAFCKEESDFILSGISVNSSINMIAFVGYSPTLNAAVIAFKGTSPLSITNWLQDLTFAWESEECNGCAVHTGFFSDYSGLKNKLVELYRELMEKRPDTRLIITGHSLGKER